MPKHYDGLLIYNLKDPEGTLKFNWCLLEFIFTVCKSSNSSNIEVSYLRKCDTSNGLGKFSSELSIYIKVSIIGWSNGKEKIQFPVIESENNSDDGLVGNVRMNELENGNFIENNRIKLRIEVSRLKFIKELASFEETGDNDSRFKYVSLNVGGYFYTTSAQTLSQFPASFLAKLIKTEFDQRQSESDPIVIDRDGSNFKHILEYLRDPIKFDCLKYSSDERSLIKEEAEFYNLNELANRLETDYDTRNGVIRIFKDRESLFDFLSESTKPVVVFDSKLVNIGTLLDDLLSLCSSYQWIVISCSSLWETPSNYLYLPKEQRCGVYDRVEIESKLELDQLMVYLYNFLLENN